MVVANLTDAELETVILAMRFWRRRYLEADTRKSTRPREAAAAVDMLLAKLEAGTRDSDDVVTDCSSH
jgi:hypothetical protein